MGLYHPPVQRPRPYSDITELDPWRTPFDKTTCWALYRGFYNLHYEDYGTTFTSWESPNTT